MKYTCKNCHSNKIMVEYISRFRGWIVNDEFVRVDEPFENLCVTITCKKCGKTQVTGPEPRCCTCKKIIKNSYRNIYCSKECWSNNE